MLLTKEKAVRIDGAIEKFFKAIGRKERIRNRINRLAEENYKTFLPKVKAWMEFTIKEINRAFRKKYIRKSADGKTEYYAWIDFRKDKAIDITTKLLDWEKLDEAGKRMLKPAGLDIMAKSGNEAYKIAGIEASFDILNPEAVKAVDRICSEAVKEVGKETKQAINHVIREGIKEGKSMGRVAKELRPLVGLTERQVKAVANYEKWLIKKRPDLSDLKRAQWVERYNKKLHRYRTEMISRTESMRATNEGNLIGYKDAGYKTVRWSANVGCCDLCDAENGHVYTIEESRGMLPLHPDCRCSWLPESKVKPEVPRVPRLNPLRISDASSAQLRGEQKLNSMLFDQGNKLESAMATKQRISYKLHSKLKDNKDFMNLVETFCPKKPIDPDMIQLWLDIRERKSKELIEQWIRGWAGTSGDANAQAIAMQMAAQKEFNLVKSALGHFSKTDINAALKILKTDGKALQAFLRAQYNLTQEFFKKNGITHLTGYRGAHGIVTNKFARENNGKVLKQLSDFQPVSSFTTDFKISKNFMVYGERSSIMIQSEVPIKRILSTAQTGFGCKSEAEFVLLGGRESVKIIPFTNIHATLNSFNEFQNFDFLKAFADFKVPK